MKLMGKKDIYKQWKQGYVASGEYRDVIRTCRDGIRKAKMQMELHVAMDLKIYKGLELHLSEETDKSTSPDK